MSAKETDIPNATEETEESALHTLELTEATLKRWGAILDRPAESEEEQGLTVALAERLLKVRSRASWNEPLNANAVQMAYEQRRGSKNIVLKARQMGLTTWAAARFFLKTITRPGTLTLEVAHTHEAAEELFRIVHRFFHWLPVELHRGPLKHVRASVRQLAFPGIDSQYRVVSAGERNAGRGMTVQNLHCSELARWPGNAAETLAGLRASLAPTAEMILESTPNGVGGCFHEEWVKADETGTVRHFFPWWMEPHYRAQAVDEASLTAEEQALRLRHGLDLEQIAYRRKLSAEFRGLTVQEFAEDAESCFRVSGESVFELAAIEARLQEVSEPAVRSRNGDLEQWLTPVRGKRYVVAVDPAGGGVNGDYSAAQVLDLDSGLQCAEFAGHMGGLELAKFITKLATEYNNAWLVVERNNHGTGILALAETACRYERIYQQGGQPGWLTNVRTRPDMIGQLDAALVTHPECFVSRRLLGECRSFVRLENGGTGARAGTHDDRVIAMAIALAVRAELLGRKGFDA